MILYLSQDSVQSQEQVNHKLREAGFDLDKPIETIYQAWDKQYRFEQDEEEIKDA